VVKTPERDLSLLIAAVHDPPGPEPEALVRYVDDPDSLSDAERAEVEDALSADPLLAGELRALQSSRVAALLDVAEIPARSAWRSLRPNLCIVGPLGAVAAAAALLALVWVPELALAPAPSPRPSSLDARLTPDPVVPAGPEEPTASAVEPSAPPREAVAAPILPLVATAEAPRPEPRAPEDEPGSVASAPEAVAVPEAAPEPVVLAVLEPQYRPPADAQVRYRSKGGTRAAGEQAESADLELLAPAHVALTRSPAPSLFWSLAVLPADSAAFSLTLSAAMTPEPLLERPLPRPDRAGLQRIRLAGWGIELEPGVEYTWTVSADIHGDVTLAQGWIQRADALPELPLASPGERPAQYAAAGLWYDAVESLADLAQQHPDDENIASALRALAAQARLEPN
jgi:hypothetical protein